VQKRFGFALKSAIYERADRHRNREIGAAASGLVRLSAGLPGLGVELPFIAKFDQRRKLRRGL
jgi:hypothetical protein